jgi:hypothetical protein
VPSLCVGDARQCAGRGAVRARSAVPQRPRQVRANQAGLSLHLRPLGRYSSGARGTTAAQASALEPSVNELINTTFGCYPSSKAVDAMPKGAPSVGTHAQHATLLMPLKCCNFRPTGPFGITLRAGCVMDGAVVVIPHCHWLSRTIYGTSRRVASSWT